MKFGNTVEKIEKITAEFILKIKEVKDNKITFTSDLIEGLIIDGVDTLLHYF